jgi:spermidine synthase
MTIKTKQPIQTSPTPAEAPAEPRDPYLYPLLLLFVGSGCAALIYEVVWFQMLQLVIGSSGVSIGVLLGTFMGGMCVGSLLLPRLISVGRHPLRVYAWLEAGIGVCGLLLLVLIPLVGGVYSSIVGYGLASILLRGLVCALLLLPPTLLMGATLPAISRWVETTPRGVSWMGFFYGGNIAGAVLGALLAGFYLLRVYDATVATFAAVALNAGVAGAAFVLAGVATRRSATPPPETATPVLSRESAGIYVAIALSGLTALGAQVVWNRLLSLLLGATVYTFSIILAVFLAGLGIGSSVGSFLARTISRPRVALGVCQAGLAASIAWAALMLSNSLPYWPVNPAIASSPRFLFQLDLARTAWTILPATLLWGASFPLAVAAAAARGQDPGRLLGGVYAANTVGAILGAAGFGMLLIPWIGVQDSTRVLVALAALSALVLLLPVVWPALKNGLGAGRSPGAAAVTAVIAVVVLSPLLVRTIPRVPPVLVAYGRYAPTYSPPNALFVGDGMNASIAVTELANGYRNFHVSGKIEASTEPQDMRLQRMLGHISALMHEQPRTVLVVGFGAGVTAGAFLLHPSVERIVICEIEPLIPKVVSRYFADANYDVLNDPRVEVIYDDARHYILTTDEKFDIITSDPIHPWVKGAAALYTREYFELASRHLNPGGVITQWVPLYESDFDVVRSELATFFQVFPYGTVWSNDIRGQGYDVVLVGQTQPTVIDVDAWKERLERPDHYRVATSLVEVGFWSAFDLLGTFAGYAPDLAPWLAGAQINRDRNLRLMYIAGLGANLYRQGSIYDEILRYRRLPEGLFMGSQEALDALRVAITP